MAFPTHAPSRRSERGLSMVLAMLVLFVVIVVVYQTLDLSLSELDQASHYVASAQMTFLAEASVVQAGSVLLMDIEDREEEEGGGLGSGLGAGLGGGDGGGGLGGDEGGDSAAQVTMNTDSLLDEWMNPTALAPPMGEGLTVYVQVVDEDSKINLLGLWAEDEEKREEWREVFTRLLDRAFEGTSLDLSATDTSDIIDELDDWVKGQRRRFRRPPLPPLKKSRAQEEADRDGELDTDIIENEEVHFPLTLPELTLIEDITPQHMWGFVEDEQYYPGLMEYLTLWSELELKDPPAEEDEDFADSPFAGSVFDDELNSGDEETPPEDLELAAKETAGGRVNANTASKAVLRALAPDEIPDSFLDRVVEFRERIRELRTEFDDNIASFAEGSVFGDTAGDEDDDEEEDPAHFVFQTEDEVFSKVEEEWELSVFTDDEQKSLFISRLGVISNVFTIKVLVRDPQTDRRASYRSVVWRLESEGEDPRIVTLVPMEPYEDTRRLADFPDDMADQADRRFERPDGTRFDF